MTLVPNVHIKNNSAMDHTVQDVRKTRKVIRKPLSHEDMHLINWILAHTRCAVVTLLPAKNSECATWHKLTEL